MIVTQSLSAPPLVRLSNVSRRYSESLLALDAATFDIDAGESVAIVGPSGSGKSTLLALLGLLDTATSGDYWLNGEPVAGLSDDERTRARRDSIGFVFQAFHLVPHFTVTENVEYALTISGIGRDEAHERSSTTLSGLGMAHRANAFPATLSGGEQQRVAIARAIVRHPPLLLCDEPTGNLDSTNSHRILNALAAVREETSTLVIVTHDPTVAAQCSRQLHVEDGHVREL